MTPDRWVDLGLNLLSEALGILVAVYWIDQRIKKREAARWKPSKHIVYSRLVEITDNLIDTFFISSLRQQAGYVIHKFGEIRSVTIDMSKIDFSDAKLQSLLYTDLGSTSIGDWLDKRKRIMEVQAQMDRVISDSAFFLEPEILSLLFTLKQEVNSVMAVLSNLNESAASGYLSEDVFLPIAYSISQFLTSAKNVEMWLVNQSTGQLIYEDFRRELLEKYSNR